MPKWRFDETSIVICNKKILQQQLALISTLSRAETGHEEDFKQLSVNRAWLGNRVW